jgi:GDP-4-dehydro-6-deoxy-D-mannose reductase
MALNPLREPPERVLIFGGRSFFAQSFLGFLRLEHPSVQIFKSTRSIVKEPDWITVDPLSWTSVATSIKRVQPDVIVNFAGIVSSDFHRSLAVNAVASKTIAAAAKKWAPHATLILIGSAAEYGLSKEPVFFRESDDLRPTSIYGISKAMQSSLMPQIIINLPSTIYVRPFNLVGNDMPEHLLFGRVRRELLRKAKSGQAPTIEVGFLGDFRDFIEVDKASKILYQLMTNGQFGEIYNIGSGNSVSVRNQLLDWLKTQTAGILAETTFAEKGHRAPTFSSSSLEKTGKALYYS